MASADFHLIQFDSTDPMDSAVNQRVFSTSMSDSIPQIENVVVSETIQQHIYPAQNPMPRGAGQLTQDPQFFSDSPENDPSLSDLRRYAYGRRRELTDSPYGSLSNDHGVLIKQTAYTTAHNTGMSQNATSDSLTVSYINDTSTDGSLVSQGLQIVSTVDVEQFAFLLLARPIPFSIKNPVDSDVYIRLANHGVFPLASGTVSLRLNGVLYGPEDLTITPFYTGNGGLDITWSNTFEFEYGQQVDVDWRIADTDSPPSYTSFVYWFRTVEDRIGPRLVNQYPLDDSTSIVVNSNIRFDLLDFETSIDTSSLELYVNNVNIDIGSSQVTITTISNGIRVEYTPEERFLYGDTIPVVVRIKDASFFENKSFFVWSFTTEESIAPFIVNQIPAPCSTNVVRFSNLSFEIVDGGHGLDRNSVVMGVDNFTIEDALIIPIVRREE